jgi:hypothetical protein
MALPDGKAISLHHIQIGISSADPSDHKTGLEPVLKGLP